MKMNSQRRMKRKSRMIPLLFGCLLLYSCASHLKDAKLHYAQGQELSRIYKTEEAIASFQRSLEEAEQEVAKNPSAQAFMLKGMAEVNLEMWHDAEESFLDAFSWGFPKGQEWAEQVSLFGLASSLEEMGLEESAFKVYSYLVGKSKFRPVTLLSSQRYTDIVLRKALQEEGKERERSLERLLRTAEKLSNSDLSCGYYHYLQSQILSHTEEFKKSFEAFTGVKIK